MCHSRSCATARLLSAISGWPSRLKSSMTTPVGPMLLLVLDADRMLLAVVSG